MAIDTEGKRRSAQAVALGFLVILPVADGTIGAPDRAHAAGFYAGLTYEAPIIPPAPVIATGEAVYAISAPNDVSALAEVWTLNAVR